tara:strand:+ start:2393 stop:3496 length:1104 start_codon:yes stop_codon:yes gene_type:complete
MKLIITQKQSSKLIKEAMGVPKSVDFWVNVLVSLVEDGLLMSLDGGDGGSLFFGGDEVMEKAFSLGWSPDSSGFNELPLVEPSLHINIGVSPEDNIITGDDYIQGGNFKTQNTGLRGIKFPNGKEATVLTGGEIEITFLMPKEHFDDGSIVEFFKSDIKPYVESLFFHELTHVVEFYNRTINNKSVPGQELMWLSAGSESPKNNLAEWDHLIFLIYLHSSFELNARISEIYGLMKGLKIKTKKEFADFLKSSRVWSYSNDLNNFNAEKYYNDIVITVELVSIVEERLGRSLSVNEVKDYTLNALMGRWEDDYNEMSSENDNLYGTTIPKMKQSTLSTPMNFLKFWEKRFKRVGNKAIRKITKLYSLL